ncbi:hypothetical protein SAM23877_3076 [Streptomyces ambofaciens ATCC 23877]|uniref:Uncharacterized protein n=1 Tax=Streptomyces ambofaciens (strain ATCC 23877 / 3486 / DSM 40053 / JCM 4204 / NBRC 12836 / NRRL B-2516) TaxID=278992 RepID=A0A0K2ASN1_STRA7|nr:hypothetical protein SAM23877_3076 [Streptomyces ambofaciens ATCC 23877]
MCIGTGSNAGSSFLVQALRGIGVPVGLIGMSRFKAI